MKTKILSLAILSLWSISGVMAQDRTTVTANNPDISANLDLRAVASIFGDSKNLDDFERRLNDPRAQISNLDLNNDNHVDYLRVIESVEGNVHLIIIQSVLGLDTFQDVATVEVERDRYNNVQVQVVGDVYMYGRNYIYEPVYAYTPVIYNSFWVNHYRPYCSSWYWGYYPTYYVAWTPFPFYTYHNHISHYINHNHYYNYVDYRRCEVAYNNYYNNNGRRGSAYEIQYPTRSFSQRNVGYINSRELATTRSNESSGTRSSFSNEGTRSTSVVNPTGTRTYGNIRTNESPKPNISPRPYGNTRSSESSTTVSSPRPLTNTRDSESTGTVDTPRTYGNTRSSEFSTTVSSPRPLTNIRDSESSGTADAPRTYGNTRSSESPRTYGNTRSIESPRNSPSQNFSQQRGSSLGTRGNFGTNRRS